MILEPTQMTPQRRKPRRWLMEKLLSEVVLVTPDWPVAAAPWDSGRPFEAFYDASDESWCACLTQRAVPGRTPCPICLVARTFDDFATRWSAFEREFYGVKEGTHAISKWVSGLQLFAHFDHTHIERAESGLKHFRAAKKLVAWIADFQVQLANIVRVWVAGKDNVIADVGSRADWTRQLVKQLPVPEHPVLDLIRMMFASPDEVAQSDNMFADRKLDMGQPPFRAISREIGDVHVAPTSVRIDDDGVQYAPAENMRDSAQQTRSPSVDVPVAFPAARYPEQQPSRRSTQHVLEDADGENNSSSSSSGAPQDEPITVSEVVPEASSIPEVHSRTDEVPSSPSPTDIAIPESDEEDELISGTATTQLVAGEDSSTTVISELARRDGSINRICLTLVGVNFICWFAEVCAGSGTLTQAVRLHGMTAMTIVDRRTGWDLTRRADVIVLKSQFREWRPLHTHLSPDCRPFSVAYHPQSYTEQRVDDDAKAYILAENIASIAKFIASELLLFLAIINPLLSRSWLIAGYVKLHNAEGFSLL